MAQKSSFFDTTPDDPREYPAREFAEYFSRFIGNGIFGGGTTLKVEAAGGNHKVSVALGFGWINGYLYSVYDAPITLTVDQATGANRIDRIVLRLDTSIQKRSVEVVVKKGSSPTVAPALTRSGDIYELSLAQILVQNGGTIIIGSQITDERLNTSLCGIVTGVIAQADTTAIFSQFQSWYNTKTAAYQTDWSDWFNTIKVTLTAQWQAWFDGLQGDTPVLSTNYVRQPGYGVTTGTATAYVLALSPALTSLIAGVCVAIKAHVASGVNPTLNINGTGAKPIKKANGSAAALANGGVFTLRYDGVSFILQGEGGEYGTAGAADVLAPKTIGTDAGLVPGTMPNNGARNGTITTQGGSIAIPAGYTTGGSVTASFANLVAGNVRNQVNIGNIVGSLVEGRKSALGTVVASSSYVAYDHVNGNKTNQYSTVVNVSFGFTPSIVLVYGNSGFTLYGSLLGWKIWCTGEATSGNYYTPPVYIIIYQTPAYVSSTGFNLPIEAGAGGQTYSWIAIE